MQKTLVLLFLLILTYGCGLSSEEELDDAITQAHRLLSSNKCGEAIAVLNGVGQQTSNANWLSAYASAQACNAPWKVVTFFATDLDKLSTASSTAIVGSTATFTQAVMTSPTDGAYTNLRAAINTLLAAGGITNISYANRAAAIGTSKASNLAIQTLYLQLTQLGQFSRYYGNADQTSGTKGTGTNPSSNGCYINYTDNAASGAQAYLTAVGALGTCDTFVEGNPDLTGNRARLCEGIVLMNNFLDILANVTLDPTGNNGNLGDLDELATSIETACADANTNYGVDFGGTCTVKTQSICENNADNTYNIEHLERYYAVIWEGLHQ